MVLKAQKPAKGFTTIFACTHSLSASYVFTVNPIYLHMLHFKNSLSPPEPSYTSDFLYEGLLMLVDYI